MLKSRTQCHTAACLLALAALFAAPDAPAVTVQELNRQAYEAYQAADYAGYARALEQLYAMRPQNGDVMYRLAGAYALQNQPQKAFDLLLRLLVMGLAYDVSGDEDFRNLHGYEVYDFIASSLKDNFQPFGNSEIAFTIENKDLLGEGVAHDEKTGNFFISSVRKGRILRVSPEGEADVFIESGADGMWGAFGLSIDSDRRHLWVASSAVPQFEGFRIEDFGRAGIFKFDLDSGEFLNKYLVELDGHPHLLGDLVLSSAGDVYATDSRTPMVFRLRHDEDELQLLFASSEFVSLQGLALSPDDRHLFLADYRLGLFVADLVAERIRRVQVPRDINVGGIDGLYYHGNRQLVAVQNGVRPSRVVRFWVDEDYREIVGTEPIESSHPRFDDPTLGTFVNDVFYYIANSQWPVYGADGEVEDPDRLKELVVLRTTVAPDAEPRGSRIVPVRPRPQPGQTAPGAPPAAEPAPAAAPDEPDDG